LNWGENKAIEERRFHWSIDMQAFASLIILASVVAFVLGVVNLIKPMAWMKVHKRHIGAFMVLGSLGGCFAGGLMMPTSTTTPAATGEAVSSSEATAAEAVTESKPVAAVEEKAKLTGPQKNAVRSARNYLSISGFSRDGLINQLSSDYGDGYSVADATAAVDSMDIDWNANAARSASQYLSMTGFSCNGLVEQLSSSAGDKYTQAQARHGAQAAGAC